MEDDLAHRLGSLQKNRPEDVQINFDIIHAREVDRKYVVYVIIVTENLPSKVDQSQAVVERRFSDFDKLHQNLKKEFPQVARSINFPKKTLFAPRIQDALIEERWRELEKYLMYISHKPGVLQSKSLANFFYSRHQNRAIETLKLDKYEESLTEYRLTLELQRKLKCRARELVPTMCGIVCTSMYSSKYRQTLSVGHECYSIIKDDSLRNKFMIPLLQALTDVRQELNLDCNHLLMELQQHKKRAGTESIEPLRVLLVKK